MTVAHSITSSAIASKPGGSLEIEDQLELDRLYNGQIGGLFPL
jgi:hypothetical protein